jgi:rsbT co-antagonist protein RsbR
MTLLENPLPSIAIDSYPALRQRVAQLESQLASRTAPQLDAFFDRSLDLLCVAGYDGYFKRLNPAWETALGYSLDELMDVPFISFVHPDDVALTVHETSRLISEGLGSVAFVNRYQAKDGSYRAISWSATVDEQRELFYATAHDITSQRAAEEGMRMFQEMVRGMPVGMLVCQLEDPRDPSSLRVVDANLKAKEFTGLDAMAMVNQHIIDLFPSDQQHELVARLARYAAVAQSGVACDLGEVHGRQRGGSEIWYTIRAFALPNRRVCIVFDDVTERKRAADAMQYSKLQEEVIRAQELILNELSTPLLTISDKVLVMPLIGAIDSGRAKLVIETLLNGVSQRRASAVILDITGVSVVDTQVANALLQAAQSLRLLGARVILTGIRPEVAQTLVGLGVDMSKIITRSSLQSGIAFALQR